MIPGPLSALRFCTAQDDPVTGQRYLSDPAPFEFRELDDTIEHVATDADTWETIAALYYAPLDQARSTPYGGGASELWWVVADFQPRPPMDATVPPERGTVIYVPSVRTLLEQVFNEARRPDYEA